MYVDILVDLFTGQNAEDEHKEKGQGPTSEINIQLWGMGNT